jgi:signal transduction histidine kinase
VQPRTSSSVIGFRALSDRPSAGAESPDVDSGINLGTTPERRLSPYRDRVSSTDQPRLTWMFDITLVAVVALVGVLEVWVPFSSRAGHGSGWASTLSVLLVCVPMAWRRRRPLTVQAIGFLALLVTHVAAPTYVLFFGGLVPLGIAVFSTARHGRGPVPFYGAALAALTLLTADLSIPELQEPGEIVFHWGVFVLLWLAGYALAVLERRTQAAMERAISVEVAAAERTMAAVVEERTRIARELHDIVAHSVSMMVVQAGAAELVVDEDPSYARQALTTIRTTGNDALAEMRRLVTMLRDAEEQDELAPQPGVEGLPALVEDMRHGGLDASLEIAGDPRRLPVGLDLAAFRIVQEALTNVRRHAAASRVRVRLSYEPDELAILVADDGVGAQPGEPGHGLIGMRERAALYGGVVETESGDGFTVRVILPVARL